jgi:predicted O-methyltransferase YrrM
MDDVRWTDVDEYFDRVLSLTDPALDAALKANHTAGLPAIDVSPSQGKFLNLLARMIGAKRILEIGALGGYSSIWLGRALPPDGNLLTLELSPKHADVARQNLARAGLETIAEVRVGPALDSLAALEREGAGPFDFIFIDADKPNNANYLKAAVRLARKGAVIVCDNVVRGGELANATSKDSNVRGARALFETIAEEPKLSAVGMQTVGSKGWDGFAIALVV